MCDREMGGVDLISGDWNGGGMVYRTALFLVPPIKIIVIPITWRVTKLPLI